MEKEVEKREWYERLKQRRSRASATRSSVQGFHDLHMQPTAWSMKTANYIGVDAGGNNIEETFERALN